MADLTYNMAMLGRERQLYFVMRRNVFDRLLFLEFPSRIRVGRRLLATPRRQSHSNLRISFAVPAGRDSRFPPKRRKVARSCGSGVMKIGWAALEVCRPQGETHIVLRRTPMTDRTIDLDKHRGMTAQKETGLRRLHAEVRAQRDALRARQDALEEQLVAAPAANWEDAAEKARYLLNLFAGSIDAQDPRRQKLIAVVLDDFRRLSGEPSDPSKEET